MNFIKQCKGKDIQNVPKNALESEYLVSIKFDGNYCQIHKFGDSVQFFSSSGKEYFFKEVAAELISLNPGRDFILESEYTGDTFGKLGDRKKSRLSSRSKLKNNYTYIARYLTIIQLFKADWPFKKKQTLKVGEVITDLI